MSIRAFIAVELDDAPRRAVARLAGELSALGADVKWVETDNIHVTLKFLGQVQDADLREICRVMDRAVTGETPFLLEIAGTGSFPPGRKPRTIWVGLHDEGERLAAIFKRLDDGLQAVGVPPERRGFAAHVTIGRTRSEHDLDRLTQAIADAGERVFGEQTVDAIALFQSDLTPDGPVYTPMYHAKFRK